MRMLLSRIEVLYRISIRANLLYESRTRITWALFVLLLFLLTNVLGCERATRLTIEGTNPPRFGMTGNGSLRAIKLVGPIKQRDAPGEEASVYWLIESKEPRSSDDIGTVTYGQVPEGYLQVYPESGSPPPLIDGVKYSVRIVTANAPEAYQMFTMRNGEISVIYSQ